MALQRIKEKDFDIVITDVRMNEIDGIEVLSEVRAKSGRTKVIMITGYAMMELARQAMEKGAYDFIAKPFKPEELLQVVLRAADALES
jgi:DNA-binding NtrC family response regulator